MDGFKARGTWLGLYDHVGLAYHQLTRLNRACHGRVGMAAGRRVVSRPSRCCASLRWRGLVNVGGTHLSRSGENHGQGKNTAAPSALPATHPTQLRQSNLLAIPSMAINMQKLPLVQPSNTPCCPNPDSSLLFTFCLTRSIAPSQCIT
jgi:hypothetical protein